MSEDWLSLMSSGPFRACDRVRERGMLIPPCTEQIYPFLILAEFSFKSGLIGINYKVMSSKG